MGSGLVRQVSHAVNIGGVDLSSAAGIVSFNKTDMSYSAGSTCDVVVSANYDLKLMSNSQTTIPMPIVVTTTLVINGVTYPKMEEFSGIVDTLDLDPKTSTYHITGSSHGRLLVNAKITETVAGSLNSNQGVSDAVKYLIAKYGKGLTAHVDTFNVPLGSLYKSSMVNNILNVSVWDFLTWLANRVNADLFVKGSVLYFIHQSVDPNADVTDLKNSGIVPNFVFTLGTDIVDIDIRHAPLFAHDVTVTVKSYQPRTNQSYISTKNMSDLQIDHLAKRVETQGGRNSLSAANAASLSKMHRKKQYDVTQANTKSRIGTNENYTFVVPNATQDDCDRLALKLMGDISQAEFLITLTVLGRPDFNSRQHVRLANMPETPINQVYAVKSVETSSGAGRRGQARAYLTRLTLVNHAVQTAGTSLGM